MYTHCMMEGQEEVTWLQSVLSEASADEPDTKRVKVADIHDSLEVTFTPNKYTHNQVSKMISKAFPQSFTKRAGKRRLTHVHGVDWKIRAESEQGRASTSLDLVEQKTASTSHSLEEVLLENEALKLRIRQLEDKVQCIWKFSCESLAQEAGAVIKAGSMIVSGPDTPEHLEAFSIDGIISELKAYAPTLLQLVQSIGEAARTQKTDGEIDWKSGENIKAVTALCTLLNTRSKRAKGMQLLVSLMLIARATSRQVS